MRKYILFVTVFLSLFAVLSFHSSAQEVTTSPEKTFPTKTPAEIEAYKQQLRVSKPPLIEEHKQQLRASKSAVIEQYKAQMRQQKEVFQQKLQTIRDEKKKDVVGNIDEHIATMNERRTTRLTESLKKLEGVLTTLQQKAADAKAAGKDTAAVDAAITKAQTAITTAEDAVANQAIQEYVISITTENELRQTVGATLKDFQSDMRATHETVIAAKKAVMEVVKALRTVLSELTGTATVIPTETP